nr:MAG TPA: hypothetical protein [Caudoviricetes sp.]
MIQKSTSRLSRRFSFSVLANPQAFAEVSFR